MKGLLALLMVVWVCLPVSAQERPEPPVYRISELNTLNPAYGTYEVSGFVVKVYECPVCPEGAQCKPCMPDHIVIAERRSRFAEYMLTNKEMIVFVDDPSVFKVNRRYRFLIQILNVKTVDQVLNNPKLIYFERLR